MTVLHSALLAVGRTELETASSSCSKLLVPAEINTGLTYTSLGDSTSRPKVFGQGEGSDVLGMSEVLAVSSRIFEPEMPRVRLRRAP